MKKSRFKKTFKWLRNTIFQSIAVLLIVAGAVFVYAAQVTFPGTQPTPPTGIVGLFVGLSTDGYITSVNSYKTMKDRCASYVDYTTDSTVTGATAHVCTPMEVLNSYNVIANFENDATGVGIMNSGPPGYTVFANDCNGWTVRDATHMGSPAFGTTWDFDGDAASLSRCDVLADNTDVFKVACCE